MNRATHIACVFRIHLARLRAEAGPFLLAALVFPVVMYLFAGAVGTGDAGPMDAAHRVRFLAGSIVFSLSLTAITWLGYLLLENRFTGRLKLFATLPLAPSSYVLGIVMFALAQGSLATISLLCIARVLGVHTAFSMPFGPLLLAAIVLVTVLCVSGVAVIIAARARSFSEGSLLTDALGAGMVFLAPIYFPATVMPLPLRLLSRVLPTTYAAHGVQVALAGGTAVGSDLLALAGLAVVSLSVGFRVMRWRED
ncbi:MAG: ABC transporter permease [Vicinamibacterales bacterium]